MPLPEDELRILGSLDSSLRSEALSRRVEQIAGRVEQALVAHPERLLAWEPIPPDAFSPTLPEMILSSWVFILRANTVSGAERHPNSLQRMMSYRGAGDFQTRTAGDWSSHFLTSEPTAPLEERWISIPENVWHQGVVGSEHWVVVSFHTASESDLIEERPEESDGGVRQRRYADKP